MNLAIGIPDDDRTHIQQVTYDAVRAKRPSGSFWYRGELRHRSTRPTGYHRICEQRG
jgi:hypothetical protein